MSAYLATKGMSRLVLMLGAAITLVGYGLTTFFPVNAVMVIAWTTIISIGVGMGYAALPMLIVRYAPLHELGSVNGVNALLRAIGTAIASALVGAISVAMAVNIAGKNVPSSSALTVLGAIGIMLAVVTWGLASFARRSWADEKKMKLSE